MSSPVLALLATNDGLLAGGFGGVARLQDGDWTLLTMGLPLRSVTALAAAGGVLLAGGDGGLARSGDGGRSWQSGAVSSDMGPISGLAVSPRMHKDGVALAATLDAGIVRSTDSGLLWQSSNFGLSSTEVLDIAWLSGETVVAATAAGLVRSPNAGRAWRAFEAAPREAFSALAPLPDGEVLAAPEIGPPLRSSGTLAQWSALGGLPTDVRTSAVLSFAGRIVLGSASHGILLSTDDGTTWSEVSPEVVLCFAVGESYVYAGTNTGVLQSKDGGETWHDVPLPPLHDLRRLLIVAGRPLLFGHNSPPVIGDRDGGWSILAETPAPVLALAAAPDGALVASSAGGLFRSDDEGMAWQPVISGEAGRVTQMTFDAAGRGWAGVTQDGALLRTSDGGRTWARLAAPFGILPLVALQALPGALIAATYDARQRAVSLWRSDDEGEHWARGGDSYVAWPIVATCGVPPLVAIGRVIAVQRPDGDWRQFKVGESGFRRVVSNGSVLIALAADALWRSDDFGETWTRDDKGLPMEEILDVACDEEFLYALLMGGRLLSRPIR